MCFWGTSAGEGVPTPFCRCKVCEYARKHGGKDLRTRSCFRLDESIMLDAGADFITHIACFGMNHSDIERYWKETAPRYNITVAYDGMCIE